MTWLRAHSKRERGQALVEFAFVGIIFFILVFGMIDVGRAVWNYNTLAEATREGTRYAIVHGGNSLDPSGPGSPYYTAPDSDTMVTANVEKFTSGMGDVLLTVKSEWIDGDNQSGSRVKVTSSYAFEPMFDFLGIVSFNISSSSTMVITN
ncbi:MAG: pilus assembly protein [Chloroflexi bacterium]|nr:pilus assembly protein [Chloroflexota bacterium]